MMNAGASDTPIITEHPRLAEEFGRPARRHAELVAHPEDREGHVRHIQGSSA